MNWTNATNEQLKAIAFHDNSIPTHLASGVALEMIYRKLWSGIIVYAAKKAYRNVKYTLELSLKMTFDELIHIGHIEIMESLKKYQPGMRTIKTYVIMHLIGRFINLKRAAEQEMRIANIGTKDVDRLEEKVRDKLFQSPVNVERQVINKVMIDSAWTVLREVEKKAVLLEQQGYEQYEIAEMLGYKSKTHGNTLLKRAYAKLRKQMGA